MAAPRLEILRSHLKSILYQNAEDRNRRQICGNTVSASNSAESVERGLQQLGIFDVEIEPPPYGSEEYYTTLLTPNAVQFVAELTRTFNNEVDELHRRRLLRKAELDASGKTPDFLPETKHIRDGNWRVKPVPRRLQCRHVDLGDVSPSNTQHFVSALKSSAQGIQTDFDDGHCPTWFSQLLGMYNIYKAVRNMIPGVPDIDQAPVLMLRPRAWNMIEHNMMVDGKEVPGPLFDFGLLMFHNGKLLFEKESGPFFYLSKLEGFQEARLWNQIFLWTQKKLGLPRGTIKACVLIENILASFEMHEILYELREHSVGLNCGMWDYSASFVNKFGHRKDFVLPDRSKYVSMDRHFLKSYMDLVIKTCHRRGAHATGGMAANLLPECQAARKEVTEKVLRAKMSEIRSGADGFMVYDLDLVSDMQKMVWKLTQKQNQMDVLREDVQVRAEDLLQIPSGGVTIQGLQHNIGVGILFIDSWFRGQGHYYHKGVVEDSATAEISRSQVWQWIRHGAKLEDNNERITRHMVQKMIQEFIRNSFLAPNLKFTNEKERENLVTAARIFEEIVLKRDFPEFITTYLNLEHAFLRRHQ